MDLTDEGELLTISHLEKMPVLYNDYLFTKHNF
jgi:hypothetical protein